MSIFADFEAARRDPRIRRMAREQALSECRDTWDESSFEERDAWVDDIIDDWCNAHQDANA